MIIISKDFQFSLWFQFGNLYDFASHLISHYKLVGTAKTEKRKETHQLNNMGQAEDTGNEDATTDFLQSPAASYTCDICEREKTFNRAEYMIRHLKKHSLWYDCQSCGGVREDPYKGKDSV